MSGRNEQDGAEAMSRGRKPVCFLSRTESATLPAARPPETERELAMKTPSAKTLVGRRRPRPHHILGIDDPVCLFMRGTSHKIRGMTSRFTTRSYILRVDAASKHM